MRNKEDNPMRGNYNSYLFHLLNYIPYHLLNQVYLEPKPQHLNFLVYFYLYLVQDFQNQLK